MVEVGAEEAAGSKEEDWEEAGCLPTGARRPSVRVPKYQVRFDVRSSGVRSSFTSLVKRFEPQAKWSRRERQNAFTYP